MGQAAGDGTFEFPHRASCTESWRVEYVLHRAVGLSHYVLHSTVPTSTHVSCGSEQGSEGRHGGGVGGGRVPSRSRRLSLTVARSISFFRPESRRRQPDTLHAYSVTERPILPFVSSHPGITDRPASTSICTRQDAVWPLRRWRLLDSRTTVTYLMAHHQQRPVFRRVGREGERRSPATGSWKHLWPLFVSSSSHALQVSRSPALDGWAQLSRHSSAAFWSQ